VKDKGREVEKEKEGGEKREGGGEGEREKRGIHCMRLLLTLKDSMKFKFSLNICNTY
jgi:hypothetical protein